MTSVSRSTRTPAIIFKGETRFPQRGEPSEQRSFCRLLAFVCSSLRAALSLRCFRLSSGPASRVPALSINVLARSSSRLRGRGSRRHLLTLLHFLVSPLLSIRVFCRRLLARLLVELVEGDEGVKRSRLMCVLQPVSFLVPAREVLVKAPTGWRRNNVADLRDGIITSLSS